jgi:hypothetical protein
MEKTNTDRNLDNTNKQFVKSKSKGKQEEKDALINKKDVDEYDISEEHLNSSKAESNGEDF